MIKWHGLSNREDRIVVKIGMRAAKELELDMKSVEMDITACHLNGCKLRLLDLLKSDKFNFTHDVYGIAAHLDRKTGKLTGCFWPRYAIPGQ